MARHSPVVARAHNFDYQLNRTRRTDSRSGRMYYIEDHEGRPLVSGLTGTTEWPSVTHILQTMSKPALIQWAATEERKYCIQAALSLYEEAVSLPQPLSPAGFKASFGPKLTSMRAHEKLREEAALVGAQAHKRIEWMLRQAVGQEVGKAPPCDAEALVACEAFGEWVDQHDVTPIRMEQTVWSPKYGFAGSFDLLASIDGKLSLVDFKTGSGVYPEMHLQNAAYQQALIDMGHPRPQQGLIIHIPKKQTPGVPFGVHLSPSRGSLMPVFVALTKVWRWWHQAEQEGLQKWQARKEAERELAPVVEGDGEPIF